MRRIWLLFRIAAVLAGIGLGAQLTLADREKPFTPVRVLRALPSIRLSVDGMPNPPEGSGLSEASLADSISETLGKFHVPIAREFDLEEHPTLHVTVLVQRVETSYSYVIVTRLEERCAVARSPSLTVPWCETWTAYPAIGSVASDQAADIRGKVLQPIIQFGEAYANDNLP